MNSYAQLKQSHSTRAALGKQMFDYSRQHTIVAKDSHDPEIIVKRYDNSPQRLMVRLTLP